MFIVDTSCPLLFTFKDRALFFAVWCQTMGLPLEYLDTNTAYRREGYLSTSLVTLPINTGNTENTAATILGTATYNAPTVANTKKVTASCTP